jgi:hypothetical protein
LFNLLSNQTKLLKFVSNYNEQDFGIVCANFKLAIELLSISTCDLLANRRTYGVLLPPADGVAKKRGSEEPLMVVNAQLLLDKNNIISAINTLCLTEAIMVRANIINCLEFISEHGSAKAIEQELKSVINTTQKKNAEIVIINEKSNVSPIRLIEIKQRLAKADQVSKEKQNSIKNRLNQLLVKPTTTISKISSKQA